MKILLKILGVVAFVLALSLLLMVPAVAEVAAKPLKWTTDKMTSVARVTAGITMGLILVVVGVLALGSLPVLAGLLIVSGIGTLIWNLKPLFDSPTLGKG